MRATTFLRRLPYLLFDEATLWLDALVGALPGRSGAVIRRTWVSRRLQAGAGLQVGPGLRFLGPGSIQLGNNVHIGGNAFFAAIGGEIRISDQVAFNEGVHLNASVAGRIRIGKHCLIGPNVVMRTAGHQFASKEKPIRHQGHVVADIILEEDVWIGANSVILGGVRIGRGAVVGAGAVVTKDVEQYGVAVGVPARVVRVRGEQK